MYVSIKNVELVDERTYFIIFLIFTAPPPLGDAVKAVFLPHLQWESHLK